MQRLIQFSIHNLTAVIALMIFILLFGLVALFNVPIQMSPDIEKPILQVRVAWPGASPQDVDREIITRLERDLSSLNGVEKAEARSFAGQARLSLTYAVTQDMDKALTTLLSELSSISDLPGEAKQPTVRTSNSDDSPIARVALTAPGNEQGEAAKVDLENLGRFLQTSVIEPLVRVPGIAEVSTFGGGDKVMRITVDLAKLEIYRLDMAAVLNALRLATAQRSVGDIEVGKRSYAIRVETESFTPEIAREVIIRTGLQSDGATEPVRLSDIARIDIVGEKRTSFRRLNGDDAVIINIIREQGTNVVKTMELLKEVIGEINRDVLEDRGMRLKLVYDETVYISSAISLVQQNIFFGGFLALVILLLFLRSVMPTVVIFLAIPISVIGTFVAISGLGLSINVISLAGLAFAVGMVVDASIVSLENIYRLRQGGIEARTAAYNGARQVWAPILGSALTTVIVFLPVVILKIPVGQLFRDIGIAISISVLISVLISVTIIPSIAAVLLNRREYSTSPSWRLPIIDDIARVFRAMVIFYARKVTASSRSGLLLCLGLLTGVSFAAVALMPQLDYLPDGNANFVFGRISTPPGYSITETRKIAQKMEDHARPLWQDDVAADGPPKIDRFFFVAYGGGAFAGASTEDPARILELRKVLTEPLRGIPGVSVFVQQSSLFGRSVGGSRSIEIDVMGNGFDTILPAVERINAELRKKFPGKSGNQIRIRPGLDNNSTQIRISPDVLAISQAGLSIADFANAVDVFNDGIVIGQVTYDGVLMDLDVTGSSVDTMTFEQLAELPIVTREGEILRLSSLAEISFVNAPQEIRRLGSRMVMTIILRPEESLTLEDSIQTIQNEVLTPLAASFSDDLSIDVSGAASELKNTWAAMQANVATALVVIYLLMAVLLRSFALPLIILMVVPVAAAGGLAGLALLNLFIRQPLDMLTMLGFVILTGVVVNNSILMIEQTVLHMREDGMSIDAAIVEATSNRIRPIFMSTTTSLFGLLPLVIFPGAGSELYRGIGVVVFGGLLLSTFATLIFIPPMLSAFRKFVSMTVESGRS
ncbi:efflux RND transporter permease subunit [Alphaproteobacteria bacterium LSUCC0684]